MNFNIFRRFFMMIKRITCISLLFAIAFSVSTIHATGRNIVALVGTAACLIGLYFAYRHHVSVAAHGAVAAEPAQPVFSEEYNELLNLRAELRKLQSACTVEEIIKEQKSSNKTLREIVEEKKAALCFVYGQFNRLKIRPLDWATNLIEKLNKPFEQEINENDVKEFISCITGSSENSYLGNRLSVFVLDNLITTDLVKLNPRLVTV
jgi:hypothetical protein